MTTREERHNFLINYKGRYMPRMAMSKKFGDSDSTTARALREDRMPCAILVERKNSSYNHALYQHDSTKCPWSAVGQMKKGIPKKSVRKSGFPAVGKKSGTSSDLSGLQIGQDILEEELFFDDDEYPKEISDIYISTPVGIPYLGEDHKYYNWPSGKKMDKLHWRQYTFSWSVENGFLLIISELPDNSKIGLDHDKTVDLIEYLQGYFGSKFNRHVMLGFLRVDLQIDDHRKKAVEGHQMLDFIQGMYRGQEYNVVREDHPLVTGRVKCRRREIICWNPKAISNLPVMLSALEHSRDKIQSIEAIQHLAWSTEEILKRQYRYVGEALHKNQVTATKSLQAAQLSMNLLSDVLGEVGQLSDRVATLPRTDLQEFKTEFSTVLDEKLQPLGQKSDRIQNQVATLAGDVATVTDHAKNWDNAADILVQQGQQRINQNNITIGQNDQMLMNQESMIRQNNIISSQLAGIEEIVLEVATEFSSWRSIDTTTKLGIIKSLYDLKGSYSEVKKYLERKFEQVGESFKVTRWALNKLVNDHHNCSCHAEQTVSQVATSTDNLSELQVKQTDRSSTVGSQVSKKPKSNLVSEPLSDLSTLAKSIVQQDQKVAAQIYRSISVTRSSEVFQILEYIHTSDTSPSKNEIYRQVGGNKAIILDLIAELENAGLIKHKISGRSHQMYLSDRLAVEIRSVSRSKNSGEKNGGPLSEKNIGGKK